MIQALDRDEVVGIKLQDLVIRVDGFDAVAQLAFVHRADFEVQLLLLVDVRDEDRSARGRERQSGRTPYPRPAARDDRSSACKLQCHRRRQYKPSDNSVRLNAPAPR